MLVRHTLPRQLFPVQSLIVLSPASYDAMNREIAEDDNEVFSFYIDRLLFKRTH